MQGVDRTRRVGQLIRRELASIIARELPGSALGILSLTAVSVSKDLRVARVFVTALSPKVTEAGVAPYLNEHAPALRWQLGQRVKLRRVPEIVFEYDGSIERGARLSRLIDGLETPDGENHGP